MKKTQPKYSVPDHCAKPTDNMKYPAVKPRIGVICSDLAAMQILYPLLTSTYYESCHVEMFIPLMKNDEWDYESLTKPKTLKGDWLGLQHLFGNVSMCEIAPIDAHHLGKAFMDFCNRCDVIMPDMGIDCLDYTEAARYYKKTYVSHSFGSVIGCTPKEALWETDRSKGMAIINNCSNSLNTGVTKKVTTAKAALTFLNNGLMKSRNFAIKGYSTTIPDSPDACRHMIINKFDEMKGSAPYILLQEMFEGEEIAFSFYVTPSGIEPSVLCNKEYKGATDGNRGCVMTGEVGTMSMVESIHEISPDIENLMNELYVKHLSKSGYTGFIDINTIRHSDGQYQFLEFTVRAGCPTEGTIAAIYETAYLTLILKTAGLSVDDADEKEYQDTVKKLNGKYVCTIALHHYGIGTHSDPWDTPTYPIHGFDLSMMASSEKRGAVYVKHTPVYTRFDDKRKPHTMNKDRAVLIIGRGTNPKQVAATTLECADKVTSQFHTTRRDIGKGLTPNDFNELIY